MASRHLFIIFLVMLLSSSVAQATVPASAQFKHVNSGEFGQYISEYDASYRFIDGIFSSPFQLFFYNTTPSAYTLGLRMGLRRSESLLRWVWEANRGKPVGENATFSLGANGNLVLAEANGKVAWQTNTANKGVVGLKLLSSGNMVLYDSKGSFVWQSFDSPTDTLLLGQSLRTGAVTKLVSRASAEDDSDGPYSLVMEPKAWSLYYKSKNSPKPMLYLRRSAPYLTSPVTALTLVGEPVDDGFAYQIDLDWFANNTRSVSNSLARVKYNGTSSFLRLGIDGNLKIYTYNDKVDFAAWDVTYAAFGSDTQITTTVFSEAECRLPEKCGNFGLCYDNMCVACPLPTGLMGWSTACAPPKVTSCKPGDFGYYKVEGVDHFVSPYTTGTKIKESDCGASCTSDCKCLGYFYNQETSRCWLAYELKTLAKVSDSRHVGYIKYPKK